MKFYRVKPYDLESRSRLWAVDEEGLKSIKKMYKTSYEPSRWHEFDVEEIKSVSLDLGGMALVGEPTAEFVIGEAIFDYPMRQIEVIIELFSSTQNWKPHRGDTFWANTQFRSYCFGEETVENILLYTEKNRKVFKVISDKFIKEFYEERNQDVF